MRSDLLPARRHGAGGGGRLGDRRRGHQPPDLGDLREHPCRQFELGEPTLLASGADSSSPKVVSRTIPGNGNRDPHAELHLAGYGQVCLSRASCSAVALEGTDNDERRGDRHGNDREFVPNSPSWATWASSSSNSTTGEPNPLPFREEVATIGRVIHGGAIATLIDTAAMAAAWAGAPVPEQLRGATVALSVNYLAPADGQDVTALARVVRRGRRLVNVHVDVHARDGTQVAIAIVTYQLG